MKLFNKRFVMLAVAAAVVASAVALVMHVSSPKDTRIFAYNSQTKERVSDKQVIFLYAVNSTTGELKLYSPVLGSVSANSAAITQSDIKVAANATATGVASTVSVVKLDPKADRSKEGDYMPFLFWTDMQGTYQRQYFAEGVDVIYISEQPLKETEDHNLDTGVVSLLVAQR